MNADAKYNTRKVLEMAYAEIFTRFMEDPRHRDKFLGYAHFVAMKGRCYRTATDKNGKEFRLMLVGRATNGWYSYAANTADEFGKRCYEDFNKDAQPERSKKIASRQGTAFWDYPRSIWEEIAKPTIEECGEKPHWFEYIVWSNLYKISPRSEKNRDTPGIPDDQMKNLQRPACVEILKAEILALNPTIILMQTNLDWLSPFNDIFDRVTHYKNEDFVMATTRVKQSGTPVIITRVPFDKREKKAFTDAVVSTFEQLCEK